MAKLLTFRKKVGFFLKNKVWLQEDDYSIFSRYGISLCTWKNEMKWIAFKNSVDVEIIKLSRCLYRTCEKEAIGLYIFGTEGIFYKANEEEPFKRIFYKEGITGMYFCPKINTVFVFRSDGNDIIGRLCMGEFNVEMPETSKTKICIGEKKRFSRDSMVMDQCEKLQLCVLEENKYFYANATYKGLYIQNDIYFETSDVYKDLIDSKLVMAHFNKKDEKALVTLSNCIVIPKVNAYYVEKIKDGYYFISDDNTQKEIVAYDSNKKDVRIPTKIDNVKEWSILGEILGATFVQVRNCDGITIVVLYNGTVKTKKYTGAIDIKFSNPNLLSNGNLIEIKATAVYEKEVTYDLDS